MHMRSVGRWLCLIAIVWTNAAVVVSCGSGGGVSTFAGGLLDGAVEPDSTTQPPDGASLLGGDGGNGCNPRTCKDFGYTCGDNGDGCGGVLHCGACTPPEYCGGGGYSKCGGQGFGPDGGPILSCTPKSCADYPGTCGPQDDGCGGVTSSCGACQSPEYCGGGGQSPSQCGGNNGHLSDGGNPCTPATTCPAGQNCGVAADGCGGLINCGTCQNPQTCGGGGAPSQCGGNNGINPDGSLICTPTTCAALGNPCGQQGDGCGGVLTCTQCVLPQTCGGGGAPGKCGGNNGVSPDGSLICTPKTCASFPSTTCGPQADGCGGVTSYCNPCAAPDTCGGGGVPNKCGNSNLLPDGGNPCTPKGSCTGGQNCGQQADGCGGVITCGTCTSPFVCGGGGTPGVCGNSGVGPDGGALCTPKTCANAPGGPYDCGVVGDGCGGLTASCGACLPPFICGGGGQPNQCGDSNLPDGGDAGGCTGLCLQIPTCDGGTNTTTVTGRVYAGTDPVAGYGAPDPIQHAHVFIPNDPASLAQFGAQVACACDTASGPAIASTYSAIDGTFTLTNVPAGNNIPIVMQLGRWRRVFYTNITACAAGPAPGTSGTNGITSDTGCRAGGTCNTRMPRVEHEFNLFDNIPLIAQDTGSADSMECVLPKIGIDGAGVAAWIGGGSASTQYTDPGGGGRVIFYQANGAVLSGSTPGENALVGSTATLEGYDMVVFDCEGAQHNKTAAQLSNVQQYANAGGRVFGTHYGYAWMFTNQDWGCGFGCTTSGNTVAYWSGDNYDVPDPVNATVDNATMLAWLSQPLVGVITPPGNTISVNQPRDNLNYVIPPNGSGVPATQQYLHSPPYGACAAGGCPLEFTFNTDPYGTTAQQCGRVLFSDFHVYGGAGASFPSECSVAPLTPQERVLEFEIFDLGDCVQQITPPPPPTCTPKTCASYPGLCGVQSDGCGGSTPYCNPCTAPQTCGGGGTPSQCGIPDAGCVALTCASYPPPTCGAQSNGCGGATAFCNPCTLPATCGGGGTPGQCGYPDAGCSPQTCLSLGYQCGSGSNGCGGTVSCGTCPSGSGCSNNVCVPIDAGSSCVPQTCAQLGAQCGVIDNGCGVIETCPTCPSGQSCQFNHCVSVDGGACTPMTCSNFPATTCGIQGDGCGGQTGFCNPCTPPATCGGGGTPNQCGVPDAGACNPLTCADFPSTTCGPQTDGCGGVTAFCNPCTLPATCGGGGVSGQCGHPDGGACIPLTCAQQNIGCGQAGDGCGNVISCGVCPSPQVCGGGGVPYQCGLPDAGSCVPQTCAQQNISCGPAGDGCGNLQMCGTCSGSQTCGGGGTPGQCGGGAK